MKKYSDSEILSTTQKAPIPIRGRIEDVQTALIIAEIGQRFNLHIDQIGTIAELNRNMLLGLVNPQEFLNELIAAKVPEKDAREIMTEINQKIFMPLREEMRKAPPQGMEKPEAPAEEKPITPATPRPAAAAPAGVRSPSPAIPKIVLPPVPLAPGASGAPVARPSLRNVLADVMQRKSQVLPTPEPRKLLEDREEPHIDIKNEVRPLPVPKPIIKTDPQAGPKPAIPVAPAKPYSVDPYREPIDEK